ncbi:MAG: AAA family ATPase [Bryobacteraceae bacterium]
MWLHDKLAEKLRAVRTQLDGEGKLHSQRQLDGFYATFRSRFGPDQLTNIDGEALLETMHNSSNRDSLVYWLEFKDDEECPAIFGSIAGGSALKFGIYKRKETGAWMTGAAKNQREMSIEEAIATARRNRDELLAGVRLLEQLPANADDAQYAELQRSMEREVPDLHHLAWAHKYFSLLYPTKLDDYHSPVYQRFHLIKLLQEPPGGGEDERYAAAGRFVTIAAELGWHLNHLTRVLNERNKEPYRYWRIGTRDGGTGESHWERMRDGGYVAVGWDALGSLADLTKDRESKEKLRARMQKHYPNTPQALGRKLQEVFDFTVTIEERDIVLASDGARVLGIGQVTGPYLYDSALPFPHMRRVKWLALGEWQLPTTEGLRTVAHELYKYPANRIEVERRILFSSPVEPVPRLRERSPTIPKLDGIPGRIQATLERKGQVILYGPPGTGKTYWARRTACELAALASAGKPFDQLTTSEQKALVGETEPDALVRMCTFHPGYGYEDFLEGYKPHVVNGQLVFERQIGVFKRLCEDAEKRPDARFYLVVDEINRGDIPRIFGELLTLLEKDKRNAAVLLPLSGIPFRVPPNVYLVGTMNTADRSIALLDTALRRRFGFVELQPDPNVLGSVVVNGIPLGPWLSDLNRRIREHLGHDGRSLQVGHAYLLEAGKPVADFARLSRIVQDDILPLIEEYCYEDFQALVRILGTGFVDEATQRIRQELFESGQREALVQALLAPCQDILASPEAVKAEAATVEGKEEAETSDEAEEQAEQAEP